MSKNLKCVLVIVAHPDDESFLFAGASLKLAEQGKRLVLICATRGEKGSPSLPRPVSTKQMSQIREEELRAAGKILKINIIECLNYQDGKLAETDFDRLTKTLARRIEKYKPELILTFGQEGISGHKDHITIGRAAAAAAKMAKHKVREIWRACRPASLTREFNEFLGRIRVHHAHFHQKLLKGVPDKKLKRLDIRKYRAKKLAALKQHKSQIAKVLKQWRRFPRIKKSFLDFEYYEIKKLS